MFVTLTNAAEAHRGNKIAISIDLIATVYETTVERNGTFENVTLVFAPPHGTFEISESLDMILALINGSKKNGSISKA